ncbi:MAG: HAD family hydrolase, partial [Proteobacteria bacterium]|nr:HAD family hydrolase [Pseudomonadota bacterium]
MATWSDTPARARIIEFVGKVTTPGTDDFVPPDARIATFDMDGTVLTEKPVSIQTIIAMHQACVFGSNEPRRTDLAPFKQACARDYAYFSEIGMYRVLRDVGAGQTQARFRKYAGKALELARHPMSGRPLGAMVYAPMIELARYLQRHQFQVFLVSGSSQALVRKLGEMRFNLPRHQGIGTEWPLEFDPNPEGAPVFRWKAGPLRDP